MKKIFKLTSKNDCNTFIEIAFEMEDEKTESLELYFINAYEKYLFQTLVYNFIVIYL